MQKSQRGHRAPLGAAATAIAVLAMACAACSAPAAGPGAAAAKRSPAAAGPSASASSSPDDSVSASPSATAATASPSATARPAPQASTNAPAPAKAPVTHTTTAPALTKTYRPYSNSEVHLVASMLDLQQSGLSPSQFIFSIAVYFSIPSSLDANQQPATVCAAGAPSVTWEYVGLDSAWHTVTEAGDVSGVCINVGGATVLQPEMIGEGTGSGPDFQVKIVSVSLPMTGPDGAWTATG